MLSRLFARVSGTRIAQGDKFSDELLPKGDDASSEPERALSGLSDAVA